MKSERHPKMDTTTINFSLVYITIVIQDKLKFLVPTFGFPEEHTHLLSVGSQ